MTGLPISDAVCDLLIAGTTAGEEAPALESEYNGR
jgi:hypothetical protein